MEGASWIAKKGSVESSKFASKLYNIGSEFDRRAQSCITDPQINEVDGVKFRQLADWLSNAITSEGHEIKGRFETLLENVNYHMSEANKAFGVQP
jgi:hypothetical protein